MAPLPRLPWTLHDPQFERDACGVGFVADLTGSRSRRVLDRALEAVVNLTHRGAVSADAKTGDGAGVLTQIPAGIFNAEAAKLGFTARHDGDLGVGMVFLPKRDTARARQILEKAIQDEGLAPIGWRPVPVNEAALGEKAAVTAPQIENLLVGRPAALDGMAFERKLYLARKAAERAYAELGIACYVPSLSNKTIVYKGLLVAPQLTEFYLDLRNPAYTTALAVFHQRYSTNTFPTWDLAQPFRMLGHNGEINTLQGNRNWMRAREAELASAVWGDEIGRVLPVIQPDGSDSTSLDNALELLVLSGRDPLHAMMMLVPEAWENMPDMDPALKAFYEYHACLTEPWDGPAALAFTDGTVVAATLDRNGLRPARYKIGDDNIIVMASEVGTTEIDDDHVVEKGRIGPGQVIAVDTARGVLLRNDEIKRMAVARKSYGQWLTHRLTRLSDVKQPASANGAAGEIAAEALLPLQRAQSYTTEEAHLILRPLYVDGVEPVGSLGDDTPLAVLATKPRLLYSYFRQRFAQVTNPPIDPLREQIVMSLYTYLGQRGSLLEEREAFASLLRLDGPVLTDAQLQTIRGGVQGIVSTETLPALFPVSGGAEALRQAVLELCARAERAVDAGKTVIVVSDRGVDRDRMSVPMLMAVGAVHHHLIRVGKRMKASLIAEAADARDPHQLAALIGYGASAINPYLALATIKALVEEGHDTDIGADKALGNYVKTLHKQLLKIMSKMGISTVTAYHGAQIFEAIGLGQEVVDLCFAGTPSPIGGIGFGEVAAELVARHAQAFAPMAAGAKDAKLDDYGFYRYRRGGEPHGFSPISVRTLHNAIKDGGTGRAGYDQYIKQIEEQESISLRDMLRIKPAGPPVPLDEVEPAKEIVKRFNGGSMSFGALSIEAHETIAVAFNRIGSKSGSGEGGEDPRRFRETRNGDRTGSKMKQVASGRFGVTPEYLAMADVLEIKMAQGSKPGEGGQLPGHKVTEIIARARRTVPGVPLISPPPHHDIYSIEDLKQLIYDLKVVNPRAQVAVKLVSEAGVGTIAAGVAKGYADYILISGTEGGTGASPWISIKYAGSPWELGLAETQQVLVANDLRGRIILRTDGGFRRGRDVVIGALLGAEEYGFGTAAMVAVGCQVARQCHLNTCPVGVATQDPVLREKFWGTPEMLVKYLFFVAEELREHMAALGFRKVEEMIGRSDLLEQVELPGHPKANTLDLRRMLASADPSGTLPVRSRQTRNDNASDIVLDDELLPLVRPAIEGRSPVKVERAIRNVHRTVGARIAGEIAYHHGDTGLPENSIELRFSGSAGQSFGAFLVDGMHMTLEGEANDYVGKGMHGGEIVLRPPQHAAFHAHDNTIMGNTVLYGATGGHLYASGRAGERFAVRNSGAWAVIEGAGDHACEYMTGGVVVILGPTGRNLGAGMSGGVAFVLDYDGTLAKRVNSEMVGISEVDDAEDQELLQAMVTRHMEMTRSKRAEDVLDNWSIYLPRFKKVAPLAHVAPPAPRDQQRARRDAMLAASQRRNEAKP
ncbi:MAG: glutamate synthase large subunit [SAR202 cluster bacterium]|nr:glutamate synthase large subunit [SAR202 cluster bacterium]